MQLANYSEHFSSLESIKIATSLLSRNPRYFEQLCRDIKADSPDSYNHIANTLNFLVDGGIIQLDEKNKLSLANSSLIQSDKLSDKVAQVLMTEPFLSKISPALLNHYEFGLCIDGGRLKKEFLGTPSLYHNAAILKLPVIGRFWPVSEPFKNAFLKEHKIHLTQSWQRTTSLSLESLKKKLANQEKAGEEAELWVLSKEKERLKNHPFANEVARISEEFVNAGFDIVSFKNSQSLDFDKFIEVKSFTSTPEFYLTFNEVEKAKELGSSYILVVVNRNRINDDSYKPIEIINPYNVLLAGELPENISIAANSWKVSLGHFDKMN